MTTTALDARAPAVALAQLVDHEERLPDLVVGVLAIPFEAEPRVRHALVAVVRSQRRALRPAAALAAVVAWLGYALAIVVHLLAALPLLVSVVLAWALVLPLLAGVAVGRAVGRVRRRR